MAAPHALGRHVALIGFMGAGKTTLGLELADRIGRPFVDVDDEIERRIGPIGEFFDRYGEDAFRNVEATTLEPLVESSRPHVLALGGGAVTTASVRDALAERAFTLLAEVDVDEAWRRVGATRRPLARDESAFRRLYDERLPLYDACADARARDADGAVLAAAGVSVEIGSLELLGELVPGDGAVALVTEPWVAGIHGAAAQLALGERLASTHEVPTGEAAKTLPACEALWDELRLDRTGTLVALGGGCVTDSAGFVAATYLRGIDWVAVPTTLVGQVDAAIGGKTAIDLAAGKNLAGAFHWPVRVASDPALLETLPAEERRTGMAEAVKTGLLAGAPLWELPDAELVRRAAAYKSALCLRDPFDRGPRAALNLGHTFAHALEAGTGYALSHGDAVALGLTAALRLSERHVGLDRGVCEEVERIMAPQPVAADRDRAWAALRRDKKSLGGRVRLVLLEAPGRPVTGVELGEAEVREALDALIA